MKQNKLYSIWNQVPVDYYQSGMKNNLPQKIWHTSKIGLAKKIIIRRKFRNCLDVGCASGYMLSEIAKVFPNADYVGVDVYDKAIFYAKKKYPHIKFIRASAEKLPFKENSFDLVLFYETIEHVEDPANCLKELKRILAKKGTAIVTMDSGSWLFRIVWFIWEKTKGKVWQGAHLHPFTHDQLGKIIERSGFKIEEKILSFFGMEVTFVLNKK